MDYRSRILAAIDTLQARSSPIAAEDVAAHLYRAGSTNKDARDVPSELRAMAKAGIVVYDRKASGWRRA